MRLAFAMFISLALAPAPDPQTSSQSSDDEMLHVDGRKNPELIPQWSAWGFAFRIIAGGRRELPTSVHGIASAEERELIKKQADAAQTIDPACEARMSRLRPLILKEKAESLNAKAHAILLECRSQTLKLRDRLLQDLSPDTQAALIAFVESTKAGTTYSIRKSRLARYLEPE